MADGAIIIYGRGDSLGNFKVFADHLKTDLASNYQANVSLKHIETKKEFFDFLKTPNVGFTIAEVHIMSHAFGAGLALGYGGSAGGNSRKAAVTLAKQQNREVTKVEVLDAEVGIGFVEDLSRTPYSSDAATIQANLKAGATVKIWGCNAGVADWTYDDDDIDGDGADDVYWTKLNTATKPSIAKALATYFQRTVIAAKSGSHIEVLDGQTWITSDAYKAKYGNWPPASVKHRLVPDQGGFVNFTP